MTVSFSQLDKNTLFRKSACGRFAIQTMYTYARVTRVWYVLWRNGKEVCTFDKLEWARTRANQEASR
jgi:hypothetical protein